MPRVDIHANALFPFGSARCETRRTYILTVEIEDVRSKAVRRICGRTALERNGACCENGFRQRLSRAGDRCLQWRCEADHAALDHETDDRVGASTCLQIGEYEGPLAAHQPCVAIHDFQRRAHHRREVDLVDDEQVGLGNAGAALAWNRSEEHTSELQSPCNLV